MPLPTSLLNREARPFSPMKPDETEGVLCDLVAYHGRVFLRAFTREILFVEPAETVATGAFISLET